MKDTQKSVSTYARSLSSSPSASSVVKSSTSHTIKSIAVTKYTKISQMQRTQLLHRVFFCQQKIKDAAKELEINYSSAKTILHIHRKKFRFQNNKNVNTSQEPCSYKILNKSSATAQSILKVPEKQTQIQIITSQGGKIMENDLPIINRPTSSSSSSTSMIEYPQIPTNSNSIANNWILQQRALPASFDISAPQIQLNKISSLKSNSAFSPVHVQQQQQPVTKFDNNSTFIPILPYLFQAIQSQQQLYSFNEQLAYLSLCCPPSQILPQQLYSQSFNYPETSPYNRV